MARGGSAGRAAHGSTSDRLVTPEFARVTASALAYFIAIGALIPVLPRYVEDELGGNGLAIGVAVGAFAFSAAVLRPRVGRLGDERGRRLLVVGGALVACLSILGYNLATNLPVLVVMRLLTGVGEGALFVGAATAAQDLAPPARRGEAASYFSVAVYGGIALGPLLGEFVSRRWGPNEAWLLAAALCGVAALLAAGMSDAKPEPPVGERATRRMFHPAAVRPGVILSLSSTAFAGFSAFLALYADDIGLGGSGSVFALYAVGILGIRIFGARIPDRLGGYRGSIVALLFQTVGLTVVAAWAEPVGLYIGTALLAVGASLLYPSLLPMVLNATPDAERSQAIATFTLFFDVSQGLAGPLLGGMVALAGTERAAFAGGAVAAAVGVVILRSSRRDDRVSSPPAGRTLAERPCD